tara:strand:+ start:216 stop:461 length:246 start_codon:yes stop_codon:yes gene_type:complete
MPYGKGTYGSKVGRPKKTTAGMAKSKLKKNKMADAKTSGMKTGSEKNKLKMFLKAQAKRKAKRSKPLSSRKYFNNIYEEGN